MEARAVAAEARAVAAEGAKARLSLPGLGGARKSVFAGAPDEGGGREGSCSSFPPFLVSFSRQDTRIAVLEAELRSEKRWTQGYQARFPTFSSAPSHPTCQADTRALREEISRLRTPQAHPSAPKRPRRGPLVLAFPFPIRRARSLAGQT